MDSFSSTCNIAVFYPASSGIALRKETFTTFVMLVALSDKTCKQEIESYELIHTPNICSAVQEIETCQNSPTEVEVTYIRTNTTYD